VLYGRDLVRVVRVVRMGATGRLVRAAGGLAMAGFMIAKTCCCAGS
jgi:hypothetical protein